MNFFIQKAFCVFAETSNKPRKVEYEDSWYLRSLKEKVLDCPSLSNNHVDADVCVVGGGLAGLFLFFSFFFFFSFLFFSFFFFFFLFFSFFFFFFFFSFLFFFLFFFFFPSFFSFFSLFLFSLFFSFFLLFSPSHSLPTIFTNNIKNRNNCSSWFGRKRKKSGFDRKKFGWMGSFWEKWRLCSPWVSD